MTASVTPRSRILGTGHYVPKNVVSNFDIARDLDTSDEWITQRTGIRRRRVAASKEVTSDMAKVAAELALEAACLAPTQLDLIIVCTITGDSPMPACAAHLQQKLGAHSIPSFDVGAACAGFVYGLTVADQFIAGGGARCVLVVGVELLSRVLNWKDRSTCILFGDGAGAAILGPANGDGRGVLSTRIFTDASMASALAIPAGGSAEPLTAEGIEQKRNTIHMTGADVFKTAVRNLSSSSALALRAAGLTESEIDWVVPHQANLRIIAQVAARLSVPLGKFVLNIEEYGNTSSASIPIALDEAVRDGRIRSGQNVLMCALGAGISWGSAIVRM